MQRSNTKVSIVIPIYNEAENIDLLLKRLFKFIENSSNETYEIIFVDDHSTDKSYEKIKDSIGISNVKIIRLSRNSGSHIAIIAGLSIAHGDCAVFLAGDLQDPPELITEMLALWQNEVDVVWAVRKRIEGISVFNKFFSRLFYMIINSSSTIKLPPTGADFALLDKKVINGLIRSAGCTPSLGGLIASMGFRQDHIQYVKEARKAGKSKWSWSMKIRALFDAIVGFSFLPMRIMTYFGFITSLLGFIYAFIIIFMKLTSGKQIEGWASIMVVLLGIGGVQMIMLGVLGEYLWRSLEESRKKPLFLIEKQTDNI